MGYLQECGNTAKSHGVSAVFCAKNGGFIWDLRTLLDSPEANKKSDLIENQVTFYEIYFALISAYVSSTYGSF